MFNPELKDFLEEKYTQYNTADFILSDPIQIPHRFTKKEDIEISGFLTAVIAWGNRKMIIRNADRIMNIMGEQPYDFLMNISDFELDKSADFVHRTFNSIDLMFFFKSLRNIYLHHGGLEALFTKYPDNIRQSLIYFREVFFSIPYPERSTKHISNVAKNSAAKRLNMFLMWMSRQDRTKVHFGIWRTIKPKYLYLPLDVHTGNVGRKLGLLNRKQNDWKAVEEITANLRKFDAKDPVKYDFALFGLGVFEKF